jgi:hypothetical protein
MLICGALLNSGLMIARPGNMDEFAIDTKHTAVGCASIQRA